jgi:hypothetical protein
MAQLIIDIPAEDETWVFDGIKKRYGYQDNIPNPMFDDQIPEDPTTNPSTIPNPQSIEDFTKEMAIEGLLDEAAQGYDNDNRLATIAAKEATNLT